MNEILYEIVRCHRDRSWSAQHGIVPDAPDWEPTSDTPQSDSERYWYWQGKAEAFAAIMSELEASR